MARHTISIDDALLRRAQKLGKHTSQCQTVNEALREYVTRLQRRKILDLAGKLRWDERYAHKAGRSR